MTAVSPEASRQAVVEAALVLLERMGLTPADLAAAPQARPQVPAVPDDVVYGTGRMDESGRVGDRGMIGVLGWQPGDRLTLTAVAGVRVARRDPAGMVTMPAKPYLVIPAALRRRCGLRPGDHVLLAVSPGEDKLTAYSFAVVDQALRAHAPVPGQGRRP